MIRALYIHIPFCHSICTYCDFAKLVGSISLMEEYMDSLIQEIRFYQEQLRHLRTIYIGGGTPSSIPISLFERLLQELTTLPCFQEVEEYSVECNPNDVSLELATLFSRYGVNRVSMGVQTSNQPSLLQLGRTHTNQDVIQAFHHLRNNGITNINVDFIYALPGQTLDLLQEDIAFFKQLRAPHASFYSLILEEKTKLYFDILRKKITLPSEDEVIMMMDLLHKEILSLGYEHYEISNYCKPGYTSMHNLAYWNVVEYLGVGMGAHSQVGSTRFHNAPTIRAYIDLVKKNQTGFERFDDCNLPQEALFMGLRLTRGISISNYHQRFGKTPFEYYPSLERHLHTGLLEIERGCLKTTQKGQLFLGQIERELM
ncbi:MAG: radical SAM family heme chaperone HemW [bacterium]|nr:radical SAM family heme chaperone HemW [bacterium]